MDIEFKISKNPVNYKKALMFLEKRVELVKQGDKELVWLLEHPLTYSAGIRSKKEEILDKSITVIKTNRGGKITLHNPGQQIVYFVLNLNNRKKDIRNLVRQIENIIIKFLSIYKVKSNSDKKNSLNIFSSLVLVEEFKEKVSKNVLILGGDPEEA